MNILYFFKFLIILLVICFSMVCSNCRNNMIFSIIILSFLSLIFCIIGCVFGEIIGCISGGLFLGYTRTVLINCSIGPKKPKMNVIMSVIFGLICGFAVHSMLYCCNYLFKITTR